MVRCPYPAPDWTSTQSLAFLHSHPGVQGSGTWCGPPSASQPLFLIRYLKAQAHSVHWQITCPILNDYSPPQLMNRYLKAQAHSVVLARGSLALGAQNAFCQAQPLPVLHHPVLTNRYLKAQAHSVVLTSGTLAPLDTFASELGMDFKHKLEVRVCASYTSQR